MPDDTFIDSSFKRTGVAGRKYDGVQFYAYHTGILTYARISEDGQAKVWMANAHREGAPTYFASVIGHGQLKGRGGNVKRFRSEEAACRAAIKVVKARPNE
jgi:hypothetical protein